MMDFIKQAAEILLPSAILSAVKIKRARMRLAPVARETFDTAGLRAIMAEPLSLAFSDPAIAEAWKRDRADIERVMPYENIDGGVCPGERRAIYHLIAWMRPERVLEIGTHIGASTLVIARALATHSSPSSQLVTADILDVNDPSQGAFSRFGMRSPSESLAALDLGERVSFFAKPSLAYMRETDEKFDLIFLDGDHSAPAVYHEIAAALTLLTSNGIILLHDFYPDGKRLYPHDMIVPGPFVAAERILTECSGIHFLPLNKFPWETKQGVRTTCLALVTRGSAQPSRRAS